MRKLSSILIVGIAICLGMQKTHAQTNLFEGTALYEIEFPRDEEITARRVQNKTLELKVMGQKSSLSLFGQTIIINPNENAVYTLLDLSSKGAYDVMLQEKYTDFVRQTGSPEYEYTDETRNIYGFKAKKAYLKGAQTKEGKPVEIWYTSDIKLSADIFYLRNLDGFPLEFNIVEKGINLKISIKHLIYNKVRASDFEKPKGCRIVDREELNAILERNNPF